MEYQEEAVIVVDVVVEMTLSKKLGMVNKKIF
jgi:hypothetical protein